MLLASRGDLPSSFKINGGMIWKNLKQIGLHTSVMWDLIVHKSVIVWGYLPVEVQKALIKLAIKLLIRLVTYGIKQVKSRISNRV